MMTRTRCGAALILAGILALPAGATSDTQSGFYERGEEGWFWYLDPEPEPGQEDDLEVPPEPIAASEPPEEDEPRGDPPPRLSVAWIQENLEKYMHRAIDDPSQENVRAYLMLQKIGLEKAHRFTEVAQRVVPGDPLLDNIGARPNSTVGNRAAQRDAAKASRRLIGTIWQEAGVAFFFDPTCGELCARQAAILQRQRDQFGLTVMAVSVDGAIPPAGFEPDSLVADQGQADMLDVQRGVPGVYMLKPPDLWVPLAQGFVGESDLHTRTIMAAAEAGWISEEEVDSTRGIRRDARSLAESVQGMELSDDPDEVVALLNSIQQGDGR